MKIIQTSMRNVELKRRLLKMHNERVYFNISNPQDHLVFSIALSKIREEESTERPVGVTIGDTFKDAKKYFAVTLSQEPAPASIIALNGL